MPKPTAPKQVNSTGLLEADHNMADIKSKKAALETVVKDWIRIVEK
jgi:hypothetical protein